MATGFFKTKKRFFKITLLDCFLTNMPFLEDHVTFAFKFKSTTHLMIKVCKVFASQQVHFTCQALFLKICKSRWYQIIWPNLLWFSIVINIWSFCRQIYEILGPINWSGSRSTCGLIISWLTGTVNMWATQLLRNMSPTISCLNHAQMICHHVASKVTF